jgi:hypothetical protein
MSSAVRIAALLLATLMTGCLLTSCGDEEKDPGSDPSTTPSTSDGPTSSSGATPATGTLMEEPRFSFHLPQLWAEGEPISASNVTTIGGGPADGWDFTDLTVEIWTLKHFDDVSKISGDVLENFRVYAPKGKLVGLTEWAGQPAYHMVGSGSLAGYAEQFGVIWKDQHIAIRFDFASPEASAGRRREFELTMAERQAVMDSVEASWQWK